MKSVRVARIFGIDVYLHPSWWAILVLVTWSLAAGFYPSVIEGHSTFGYWAMGAVSSLLLFVCVLLHELSHSLVGRYFGIGVERITLFFFGGVASIHEEKMAPLVEIVMALAGPLMSFALAGVFYVLIGVGGNAVLLSIAFYLLQLNLVLGFFNLIPGYPLDGGRVLRGVLTLFVGRLRASVLAARVGQGIGVVLAALGIVQIVGGQFVGLWLVFLGGFLWLMAKQSVLHIIIEERLSGMKMSGFIRKIGKIRKTQPIARLRYGKGRFFACDGHLVDLEDVHGFEKDVIAKMKVKDIMIPKNAIAHVDEKKGPLGLFRAFLQNKGDYLTVTRGAKNSIVGVCVRGEFFSKLNLR